MATSIYALRHPETKEVRYIGKTAKEKRRYTAHIVAAKRKTRRPVSLWIGSLMAKGLMPEMVTLMIVPDDAYEYYEIATIRLYRQTINPGRMLNLTDGGEGTLGIKQLPRSEEWKQVMRAKFQGVPLAEETKQKMRGRVLTAEHREKIRIAKLGCTISDVTRAKMSAASKGKSKSASHVANLSKAKTGIGHSDEARAKMSATRKGRKPSDATRVKMSASQKARYSNG